MKRGIALLLVAIVAFSTAGCDLKPEQVKTIAQQVGLFSAVGWIAADNPTQDQITAVKGVVDIIKSKASEIEAGKTYTEVVYPEVEKIIDAEFDPQYKPLAKAAALSLLGGLDMLFAMHPEWKADEKLALEVVKSFCTGAKAGFNLDASDPVIVQARRTAKLRAQVK